MVSKFVFFGYDFELLLFKIWFLKNDFVEKNMFGWLLLCLFLD